ncbi:MAG TPA: type I-U CRISPR-associated protein Csx17 [Verrucomicrobiota bacterium]|nr:type I-U CRISPR-associated protein Csx17 [Verrucomicrobiota bacterium]
MKPLSLPGCAPIPLAHYLKALGVLRVIAEQVDPAAAGYWRNERFHLRSTLDQKAFLDFFLNRYQPTPIVAPWNGGSGFYEGDDQSAVEAIRQSPAPRFDACKHTIQMIFTWSQLGPTKQPLAEMTATLEKVAAQSDGKAAKVIRDKLAEFLKSLDAFIAKTGQEREKILACHIEQIEALDVGSSQPSKKALRDLLKAGKKVRTDFKKCHRASGKELLVMLARSSLADTVIPGIDAIVPTLSDGTVAYPPLFGSGGTDGRLEFTNTYLQCLCEIIQAQSGLPSAQSATWLQASLFQEITSGPLSEAPIGQFFPGAAGGANATTGFNGNSTVNPWDYVLMMEGGMLFGGAAVKKLNGSGNGSMVCPFCVSHNGAGFASATRSDEAKAGCEIWTPLWEQPTTFTELLSVFGEGRAQLRGSTARNGVDFAQAAVTLGVDRGITAFQRYALLERNGQSTFATPLGKFVVRRNARADLLADVQRWIERLRIKTDPEAKPKAPNSVRAAFALLERRIFELCEEDSPDRLLAVLAALGATERAVARSFKWATAKDKSQRENVSPLRRLRPEWLTQIADCPETRLAMSLASLRASFGKGMEKLWFRQHLEPLKRMERGEYFRPAWTEMSSENDVAWHDGDLTDALNAILARRLVRVQQSSAKGWPDWSPRPARLDDITEFIEGRVNETLLADLIWGLSLVDWESVIRDERREAKTRSTEILSSEEEISATDDNDSSEAENASDFEQRVVPSAFYALLRLCFRRAKKGEEQEAIPLVPAILHRAINEQGKEASILAARRLRASGKAPLVSELPIAGDIARRTAAAMLFPISGHEFHLLERIILQQQQTQNT